MMVQIIFVAATRHREVPIFLLLSFVANLCVHDKILANENKTSKIIIIATTTSTAIATISWLIANKIGEILMDQ